MTSPSDRPERKAREALPRSKGRCAPGESIFQLLGSRWDRLWYVSPRRTAQEVRAVLAAAEGALGAPLPEGARVLDIGCGTGRHALALARRGFLVTGVDLAPAMLRAAAAKARGARLKGRLALVRGDACRLPVRAGRFDLAISLCQGAFGEPARPAGDRRLLAEARRALRPGGALVLVALDRSWLDRQGDWRYDPARGKNVGREWHTLEDGRRRKVEMSTRAYSPLEAASLLERAGFALAGAAGAEPGAYEEHPLDGTAMQYMIAALAPKKSRVKAKRRPARKVTNAPRAR